MHEVRTRTGPQHDIGAPEILRHILAPEHAAIGDMAGYARLAVTDNLFADPGPHAVASDQRAAFDGFAIIEQDRYVVAIVREGIDTTAGFQGNQIAALAGLEKSAVDVGTMGHGVGLPEFFQACL